MKHRLLAFATAIFVVALGTAARADDPPAAPAASSEGPVYGDMFKCSDGYNPDADPQLHPPNQDPKIRMLVNAQAQAAREERLKAEAAAKGQDPSSSSGTSASAQPANVAAPDAAKADQDKKGSDKDKKDGDKKADNNKKDTKSDKQAKDGDGKDKDKSANNSSKEEKEKQAKEEASRNAALDKVAREQYSPMKAALFNIQTGNYAENINVLSKLIANEKNNAEAHYLLAVSYVGLRRYKEASDEYAVVVKLSPNSKLGQLADEGLKRIAH